MSTNLLPGVLHFSELPCVTVAVKRNSKETRNKQRIVFLIKLQSFVIVDSYGILLFLYKTNAMQR